MRNLRLGLQLRQDVPRMVTLPNDFQAFWTAYPRREAKLAAFKAYTKARRLASAEDILAGVERYKVQMPEERRFRPLPASWLNAGRWMDEDDAPVVAPAKEDWYTICQQTHNGECGLSQQRHAQRVWNEAYKARAESA
jgi:hypothetical protein